MADLYKRLPSIKRTKIMRRWSKLIAWLIYAFWKPQAFKKCKMYIECVALIDFTMCCLFLMHIIALAKKKKKKTRMSPKEYCVFVPCCCYASHAGISCSLFNTKNVNYPNVQSIVPEGHISLEVIRSLLNILVVQLISAFSFISLYHTEWVSVFKL